MTKARNIADLLDANGDVKSASLDNVPAVDLTNLSASNLTSGSIPDARVPSSAVSQHATSFDDNKLVNDISTLALRQSSNENKSAYNSNSMSVDVFQDATGIASHTTSSRDANEYVSSTVSTLGSEAQYPWASSSVSMTTANWTSNNHTVNVSTSSGHGSDWWNIDAQNRGANNTHSGGSNASSIKYDFGASYHFSKLMIGKRLQHGDFKTGQIDKSDNGSDWTGVDFTNWSGSNVGGNYVFGNGSYKHNGSTPSPSGLMSTMSSSGAIQWLQFATTNGVEDSCKQFITGFTGFTARYLRLTLGATQYSAANSNASLSSFAWYYKPGSISLNATGNFISNAITAPSSTNKVGAIITYQNQAGTNTLNTDIVLQLSADNGSNFTTATLTAMPDFATGIKMAKVNDLAVTAGTQLKYKISFANQSGSKEARIRGVSLQY